MMPYSGRMTRVDLSNGTTSDEDVPQDVRKKWISGAASGRTI